MLCTISNQVPTEPVVSRLNGCLYERRLIERYIDDNGRDPKTGEPMTRSDLIAVSCGTAPPQTAAVTATTIPGLLASLQAEWDSVMLEQFSLRQQLTQAHQELSRALYQHEASCRVIAKLLKERDVLRGKLKERGIAVGETLPEEDSVLPKEVIEEIDANAKRLKVQRQRRELPHNLAPASQIAGFVEDDAVQPHTACTGVMGVLCLDIVDGDRSLVVTGGSDSRVVCYDVENRALKASLVGHTRPVRGVKCLDDIVLSVSDDSTVRVWKDTGKSYHNTRAIKAHQGGVVGFAVLPSLRHVLSAGSDGKLAFTDFERGFTVATGESRDAPVAFSCVGLHPDGYMAVTGCGGKLLIWDVRQMDVRQSTGDGTQGSLTSVCFNEDGYTLAASTAHGPVKLYDFRRFDSPLDDLVAPDAAPERTIACNRVSFSQDGTYLAVCSNVVKLWNWKTREVLTTLASHTAAVTDAAWGKNAQWLASTSLDKTLRLYRKK